MFLEILLGIATVVGLGVALLVRRLRSMGSYWPERGVKTPTYPPMLPWGNSAVLLKCENQTWRALNVALLN